MRTFWTIVVMLFCVSPCRARAPDGMESGFRGIVDFRPNEKGRGEYTVVLGEERHVIEFELVDWPLVVVHAEAPPRPPAVTNWVETVPLTPENEIPGIHVPTPLEANEENFLVGSLKRVAGVARYPRGREVRLHQKNIDTGVEKIVTLFVDEEWETVWKEEENDDE